MLGLLSTIVLQAQVPISIGSSDLANYNDTVLVSVTNNVGFTGEGDVLDIIAAPQEGKIKFEIDTTDQLIAEQDYQQPC